MRLRNQEFPCFAKGRRILRSFIAASAWPLFPSMPCQNGQNPSRMKLFDLSGEMAVVIGGTGVLGGALAEGLAQAGAKVAVLGRNSERGAERVKAIKAAGGTAAFFAADAQNK